MAANMASHMCRASNELVVTYGRTRWYYILNDLIEVEHISPLGKCPGLPLQYKIYLISYNIIQLLAPNEAITNAVPFVIRHSSSGSLEYIDPESVPYLGYLPQDIVEKDALQLYHPADLVYLRQVYETIVKEGVVSRSKPYRYVLFT